jgi:hypothetical protein
VIWEKFKGKGSNPYWVVPTTPTAVPAPSPSWALAGNTRPMPLAYGTVRASGIAVFYRDRTADTTWAKQGAIWVQFTSGVSAAIIFAICEAPVVGITRVWSAAEQHQLDVINDFTDTDTDPLFGTSNGTAVVAETSTAWTYLVGTKAEGQTYSGTAHIYSSKWALREGKIPDLSFEVEGLATSTAPWTVEANPADVLIDMLTHARRGLGLSTSDVETDLGPDRTANSSFRRYCTAMGLGVSRLITEREPTLTLVESLLQACNSTWVWSEGKFKAIVLDAESRTGNGATYTPATATTIDEQEILLERGSDPVSCRTIPDADTYNAWPVRFRNRESDYNEVTTEWIEPADAATREVRRADVVTNPWIATMAHAHRLSAWLAQQSLYTRNRYRFRLSPRWCLLEPGDMLSLSESTFGLSAVKCRIVNVEEAPDGTRTVEADEWPTSVSAVVDLTPQTDDGFDTAALVMAESQTVDQSLRTYRQDAQPTGFAVGDLWYDTNDGNKLSRFNGSTWDATTVGSGAITSSAVDIGKLTASIYDRDNLFPNPTSEIAPPDGADSTSPEWIDRYNAGAGAYSGSYVRRVTAGGSDVAHGIWVPCSPGATFYVEAMVRRTSGSGSGGTVGVNFYTTLGDTGTYLAAHQATNVTAASWTKTSIASGAAGSTANAAIIYWLTRANDTVEFDALYARRVVQPDMVASEILDASVTAGTNWSGTVVKARRTGGIVHVTVTMLAAAGASWTSILTMPVGARPLTTIVTMGVVQFYGSFTHHVTQFSVTTGGVLSADRYDNGTSLVSMPTPAAGDVATIDLIYPWI